MKRLGILLIGVAVHSALMGSASPASAQAGREKVEEGNRLYAEGRFGEAHQKYMEALIEDPESPLIRFNAGNALYQSQDFQNAVEAYRQAIESGDPEVMSAAWYNLGNTLFRGQQLEPSLEAFKQALRLDPNDVDAKHNLERVLERMQEQEQEPQQGEDEQDQEDQEESPQDSQNPQEDPSQSEDPQEQEQDPEEGEGEPDEGQDPPQDQPPEDPQDQPQPGEGEMTPEEARRLLDAIDEDPGDVNRKPAAARGRRPKKIW